MKIDRKIKSRIERLISSAQLGIDSDKYAPLNVYIDEFNSILTILHQNNICKEIKPFIYQSDHDETPSGGLSYKGKDKIQNIIFKSRNIINSSVSSKNKNTSILRKVVLGFIACGGLWFIWEIAYNAGQKHQEKLYDTEKFNLHKENEQLKNTIDSLKFVIDRCPKQE